MRMTTRLIKGSLGKHYLKTYSELNMEIFNSITIMKLCLNNIVHKLTGYIN